MSNGCASPARREMQAVRRRGPARAAMRVSSTSRVVPPSVGRTADALHHARGDRYLGSAEVVERVSRGWGTTGPSAAQVSAAGAPRSARPVGGSFRDPSGVVFVRDGRVHRQVNPVHAAAYDRLMQSGLYRALVDGGLLVAHDEVGLGLALTVPAYRVLRPVEIPFVSHPYEWCFGQLKAAALLTLEVMRTALAHDMILRDASAYNVQFVGPRPVFIDTLSFGLYREGDAWVGYRQFCEQFLAPLALIAYRDARLAQLLRVHLDGVPLDLASRLLPRRTRLRFSLLAHLHLHAASQRRWAAAGAARRPRPRVVSRRGLHGLVDSLTAAVEHLAWRPRGSHWVDYDAAESYPPAALAHKRRIVSEMLDRMSSGPRMVWDLGANTGAFARLATGRGMLAVAFDGDPAAVERGWREAEAAHDIRLLNLVQDLQNPSPSSGFDLDERASLASRGPADAVLALALVHHLAIAGNVPLDRLARFFARLGRALIVEFVPKDDSQVARLLATREDVFPDYHVAGFEAAFAGHFRVLERVEIPGSNRILYRMERLVS
jgi:hypothetical protein